MPKAPKTLLENVRYRAELIDLGNRSESARQEIICACARDPIWFVSSWLWTFDPQNHPEMPMRPLILRPHQERMLLQLDATLGRKGAIVPKSRRMGVTTLILAYLFWRWRFRRMQSFLLLSAKEDRVDKRGDPSCLFWKLDAYNQYLPHWLCAPVDRAMLRFGNPANGSIINGESTNSDADRGGVRTAVLADEVGAMPNADSVINAIAPLTESLYLVSTPKGAYGAFYQLYEKWKAEDPERIILLHWTMHEVFSKGLYFTDEPVTGYTDASWGGRKPRSPWYDKECLKLLGPKHIAQELDIAWNEAGGRYFEEELVAKLLKSCVKPSRTGELSSESEEPLWQEVATGNLRLWCPLSDTNRPPKGSYVIGGDVSLGTGGTHSSQSALSVVDKGDGRKVAEFTSNRIQPTPFARLAAKLARWFHGAQIIAGCQGPGVTFHKTLTDECGYYNIHYRDDVESVQGKRGRKMGYSEQGQSRQAMFDAYQDALLSGRFTNLSEAAVKELRQFIISPVGTVEHSAAMQSDDPEHKGKLHGDIVIADCMACVGLPERVVVRKDTSPFAEEFSPNSAGSRWQEAQRMRLHEELFL